MAGHSVANGNILDVTVVINDQSTDWQFDVGPGTKHARVYVSRTYAIPQAFLLRSLFLTAQA